MGKKYTAISLFTGAFGLDLGLEKAGFEVCSCVEKDPAVVDTILLNKPHLEEYIIDRDINEVSVREILEKSRLRRGETFLVSGGPPCQPFSTIGKRDSISTGEGNLFRKFLDVIWGIYPKYFIFENVKGIVSSSIKHVPLRERGLRKISSKEELGSSWSVIKKEFGTKLREGKPNGYNIFYWELNAADFGVAQNRKRVFIVGTRGAVNIPKPEGKYKDNPTPIKKVIGKLNGNFENEGIDFRPYDKLRFKIFSENLIKQGQNWTFLPVDLQKEAMGRGWYATGGRVGFCRRLSWDKPSPTITTNPSGRATNLCHPKKPRPLTYKECALLQGFPINWKFAGSLSQKYKQIGNAVPVRLAYHLGKTIIDSIERRQNG